MPRFFYNVHDGRDIADVEGCELPTIRAAQAQALTYAGHLLSDLKEDFWCDGEWRMEVTDERGLILFSLHFVGIEAATLPPRGGENRS